MTHHDYPAMIEYCEKLAKNGQQLSVSWNGGHDSGYFEMIIDGQTIDEPNPLQDAIISLVTDYLNYGSFAGTYDTEGEVCYNPATKCFVGSDLLSETQGGIHQCAIVVRMPTDIWFDRIDISLGVDETEIKNLSATLVIKNGPRTKQHDAIETTLQEELTSQFRNEIESIHDLSGIWYDISIDFKNFSLEQAELAYYIKKFEYNFFCSTQTPIIIELSN